MPIHTKHKAFDSEEENTIYPERELPAGPDHWYKMRIIDIYDDHTHGGNPCFVQKAQFVDIKSSKIFWTYYMPHLKWSIARLDNLFRNWGISHRSEPTQGLLFDAILKQDNYRGQKILVIGDILQWMPRQGLENRLSRLQKSYPHYSFMIPAHLKGTRDTSDKRFKPSQEILETLSSCDDEMTF